jgi:hypothetical protein
VDLRYFIGQANEGFLYFGYSVGVARFIEGKHDNVAKKGIWTGSSHVDRKVGSGFLSGFGSWFGRTA